MDNLSSLILGLEQINIHEPNEKFGGANSKTYTHYIALSPYEFLANVSYRYYNPMLKISSVLVEYSLRQYCQEDAVQDNFHL